jgi:hypothetical protein
MAERVQVVVLLGFKERKMGNELLRRTLVLVRLLLRGGSFWTIENPATSLLFQMPGVRRIIKQKATRSARLHHCIYGLHIPGSPVGSLCRQDIVGIVNLEGLENLSCKCDNKHTHFHALGSVKTKQGGRSCSALAGAYPFKLCSKLEEIGCS